MVLTLVQNSNNSKHYALLTGDTYPHRDVLKNRFGGTWYSQKRGWIFPGKLFYQLQDWIHEQQEAEQQAKSQKIKVSRRCGLCKNHGHDRRNCQHPCGFCGKRGDHLEEHCHNKKIQTNPNWKRFVDCGCSESWLCSRCQFSCCEKAETVCCVCLYAYKCAEHTNGHIACNGSHS